MKRTGKPAALCLLIVFMTLPLCNAGAQSSRSAADTAAFEFPQWAKDIRRFEIVAFGSIPFTMLIATTAIDSYRWYNENGMDMSDTGRRYAPWPLKSAGAVAMTNREQENTLWLAAGLSLTVAITDMVIAQIKRHKANRQAETRVPNTVIITRKPLPEETAEVSGEEEAEAVHPALP